jgi:acetyl esterase/lipase
MSDTSTPLVAPTARGLGERVLWWAVGAAIRLSLLVSPRPTALLVRRVFASGGAQFKAKLERHAPTDVLATIDERYGDEPDMLVDLYRPDSVEGPLPLVVWVHGGGWVGGSKDELQGWLKLIAHHGYVVVAPRYGLAPEHHYPTPPRQVMAALAYLQREAGRLGIDTNRIVIAGDSAGAQITAQVASLVTAPGYPERVGVAATITPGQLRGLVLCCGPYDLGLASQASSPAGQRFIQAVLWAYSGRRDFLDDPTFATWSVIDNVTAAFPATLITVGNGDPLRAHSELLAERIRALGVDTETLFWPPDQVPPLGHEYQFDLDTDAGQRFVSWMVAFLERRLHQR